MVQTYVYVQDSYVNVVEQLTVKLDRLAGREEDHDLLVAVLLQESEQEEKPGL